MLSRLGGKRRHFQGQEVTPWSVKPALSLPSGCQGRHNSPAHTQEAAEAEHPGRETNPSPCFCCLALSAPSGPLPLSPRPHLSLFVPISLFPSPLSPLSWFLQGSGRRPCQDRMSNGLEKDLENPAQQEGQPAGFLKGCLSSLCAEGPAVQRRKAPLCCLGFHQLGRCP